jgi:thiol-disulfide isomerase/thioredoxin
MKIWSRISTCALTGLIAANVGAAASHFVLNNKIQNAKPEAQLTEHNRLPFKSGVDVRGVKWEARDTPCRIVRIADDHCPYCKKDKPSYEKLVDAARRASCEIIEIAPQANGMAYDPRPDIVQLKFVDADIGEMLWPFATSQTIILDRDWSVKMTHRGTFDDRSLTDSLALLGSFSSAVAAR